VNREAALWCSGWPDPFLGNEEKLYTLDKDTGKVVFTKGMPNGSVRVPAVYDVKGAQCVLFSLVGGGRFAPETRLPPRGLNPPISQESYVALALSE